MKWLDKKIDGLIGGRMENLNGVLDGFEEKIRSIKESLLAIENASKEFVSVYTVEKSEILASLNKLDVDIHGLRERLELDSRKTNLRIDEKDRLLRDNMETCFTGLVMNIDRKLSLLGDKKGTVTDLLKRIAFLEGQVQNVGK